AIILEGKLEKLFKEFQALNSQDIAKILEGEQDFKSESMSSLNSVTARSLTKAFSEGIKFLPQILKNIPELSKLFEKLDEDSTKEAADVVDQELKLKEQEIKTAQAEKKPESLKPEELDTPSGIEMKPIEAGLESK
ncbi:MAG TPA: hypothetical protein VGO21_00415, partial [Candidatus Paceibacterota bacterium]|nr:hypothetical protein [Candidatus Paceibacterota bacterium]